MAFIWVLSRVRQGHIGEVVADIPADVPAAQSFTPHLRSITEKDALKQLAKRPANLRE